MRDCTVVVQLRSLANHKVYIRSRKYAIVESSSGRVQSRNVLESALASPTSNFLRDDRRFTTTTCYTGEVVLYSTYAREDARLRRFLERGSRLEISAAATCPEKSPGDGNRVYACRSRNSRKFPAPPPAFAPSGVTGIPLRSARHVAQACRTD